LSGDNEVRLVAKIPNYSLKKEMYAGNKPLKSAKMELTMQKPKILDYCSQVNLSRLGSGAVGNLAQGGRHLIMELLASLLTQHPSGLEDLIAIFNRMQTGKKKLCGSRLPAHGISTIPGAPSGSD
jgi:hypothetical protein